MSNLHAEHIAQLLSNLHGARMKTGLLVNFGHYLKLECNCFNQNHALR